MVISLHFKCDRSKDVLSVTQVSAPVISFSKKPPTGFVGKAFHH